MEPIFWVSILLVAYVYVGYPALLSVWAPLARRTARKRGADDHAPWPSVSVILAARNEAARLPGRVANLLEQRYPGPLEIIVVSDGSTDGTAEAVAPFRAAGVQLIELPAGGKPVALNAGVAAASGELLVFADARQRFAPDAILQLARNFADPAVGGVTGELILDCEQPAQDAESTIGDGVGLYWRYEKWLRRHESDVWSTLGATGAIYALRRSLWTPLPPSTLVDDVLAPMRAVLDGRRVVFEPAARAFDTTAADAAAESRRKRRTLAGNYQILGHEPRLLVPIANPVWLQYASHKIGRLLVPWALLGALVSSATLAGEGWFYSFAFGGQVAFYALAAFGASLDAQERGRRGAAGAEAVDCGAAGFEPVKWSGNEHGQQPQRPRTSTS